jgi:integrase
MPKGIKPVRKTLADGSVRVYHYHRATNTRLDHEPWSAAGLLQIAELDKQATRLEEKLEAKVARSFADLWRAYRATEFPRLRVRTRKDYDLVRTWLGPAMETRHVSSFTRENIFKLRDLAFEQRGWRFANYLTTVLAIVFKWGYNRGWVKVNHAVGIAAIKKATDARVVNRRLDLDEVEALLSSDTPKALLLPICLGLFASMREGDVLRLTTSAYDGTYLRHTASKNQEKCTIEVSGLLKQLLDERMAQNHACVQLVVQRLGLPFTEGGFRSSFSKWVKRLTQQGKVKPGVTFHGLRHTVGTFARENGHSEFDVAAAIGDRSTAMAAVYGRDAIRSTAQIRVLNAVQEHFAHITLETKLETNPSTPPRKALKS